MSQLRLSWAAACAALALALLGCGGSDETYYIPADNQIHPFTPETSAGEGAGEASPDDEDWGSGGEGENEAGSAAESSAAKPEESNKDEAPGKGAVKPGKAGKSEKPAAAAKGGGAGSP